MLIYVQRTIYRNKEKIFYWDKGSFSLHERKELRKRMYRSYAKNISYKDKKKVLIKTI